MKRRFRVAAIWKLTFIAAINGAIAGLAIQALVPDFHTKPEVVAVAVTMSAFKAVLNVLTANPFKVNPERRKRVRRRVVERLKEFTGTTRNDTKMG